MATKALEARFKHLSVQDEKVGQDGTNSNRNSKLTTGRRSQAPAHVHRADPNHRRATSLVVAIHNALLLNLSLPKKIEQKEEKLLDNLEILSRSLRRRPPMKSQRPAKSTSPITNNEAQTLMVSPPNLLKPKTNQLLLGLDIPSLLSCRSLRMQSLSQNKTVRAMTSGKKQPPINSSPK
ncbi:uncharacterized protein N7515_001170 [Penicillium bovifimosum]|uniref:Uncharacterized protein n=1 Tax=Penicillium bovifimosum TaxID=126998 RepID=A0A9W9LC50_9EURO|nr:uncharacterized protein N7515_001170 [Penicillium bovifimosum]KAJ5146606.1 hypothetical protein N7515_001170 [Penicillium bovifimosum]